MDPSQLFAVPIPSSAGVPGQTGQRVFATYGLSILASQALSLPFLGLGIQPQDENGKTYFWSGTAYVVGGGATGGSGYLGVKDIAGTTYTVLEADSGYLLRVTNASGCTITVPVGLSATHQFGVYVELAAGNATLQGDGTSTVVTKGTSLVTNGVKSMVQVLNLGSNIYFATGDLGAIGAADIYAAAVSLLAAGSNITLTPNGSNSISIASSGGVGGVSDFAETGTFRWAPAAHGSGTTYTLIGTGTAPGQIGTNTSRGTNVFNASFPKIDRLGQVGTLGSNQAAGFNATATLGTVPGTAGDTMRLRFSFGISDSIASGARMIVAAGQGGNGSALTLTGEFPTSVLNYVGITLRSNESQFRFSSRGASGTAYESALLGADFSPYGGTGTNGQGTAWFELDIKFTPGAGDARTVVMTLRNKVTGTSVSSGVLTATSTGSQLPTGGQHNFPCCVRNSGSTDANVIAATIGPQVELGDLCGGGFSGVA